jgi:hypothetical protein
LLVENCGRECLEIPNTEQGGHSAGSSPARSAKAASGSKVDPLKEALAASTAPVGVISKGATTTPRRAAADACREERHREGYNYYTLSSQNPSAMSAVRHSAESPSNNMDRIPAAAPASTFVFESSTKHTTSLLKSQPRSLRT